MELPIPDRNVRLLFHIDANRINAYGGQKSMTILEKWHEDGVIDIEMAEPAQTEAARSNATRAAKAYSYICTYTFANVPDDKKRLGAIEKILFPGGITADDQRNDVEIVFNAGKYHAILVTNDGGSKRQPGGILGHRDELWQLGIHVMTDEEAVAFVKQKIKQRDFNARRWAELTGLPVPAWVGGD